MSANDGFPKVETLFLPQSSLHSKEVYHSPITVTEIARASRLSTELYGCLQSIYVALKGKCVPPDLHKHN